MYGRNQVTATSCIMQSFVGLHAELFIFVTCDCNSKSLVCTIHSKCCNNELHENKAVRMKMHLATQKLHKCDITDIHHIAAISMTALKFVPCSFINIDVHNSIKTFCSKCFKLYVVTHYADD